MRRRRSVELPVDSQATKSSLSQASGGKSSARFDNKLLYTSSHFSLRLIKIKELDQPMLPVKRRRLDPLVPSSHRDLQERVA